VHRASEKTRLAAVLAVLVSAAIAQSAAAETVNQGPAARGGIVVRTVRSTDHVRAFWTRERMGAAQPLPAVRVSRSRRLEGLPQSNRRSLPPSYVPPASPAESPSPGARIGRASTAGGSLVEGSDTGDPTVYPNSANGLIYGDYEIEGQDQLYQCSGSVIDSGAGDIVLTAAHCVIDPESGTHATNLVFVPGYRGGSKPFGEWPASAFATTSEWESTAGTRNTDEAGDMAMLELDSRPSDSATVQSVVGALGIAFNQPRAQTYTQYGYPAESPYDGSKLYALPSTYAFADTSYSPAAMAIRSDFKPGSSGGPWVVGSAPVALSVTAYYYLFPTSLRGYMFGPYFGSKAQALYAAIGGSPSGAAATSTAISNAFSIMKATPHPGRGTVTVQVVVPGGGSLVVSGTGVRRFVKVAQAGGRVNLPVASTGRKRRALKRSGTIEVRARIRYRPSGGTPRVRRRSLTLVQRRHR
jgi:V8-like Glu-specific endopeptidase